MITVHVATEGKLDFAVAERLLADVNAQAKQASRWRGRNYLIEQLNGFAQAARYTPHTPWLVLLDLDRDPCAPQLLTEALTHPTPNLIVRVAVREIEAWLLADTDIASTLRIPKDRIPRDPDSIDMPKRVIVQLVRAHCKNSRIQREVLPALPGPAIGVGYNDLLIEFVRKDWEPRRAAARSDSLARCLRALETFAP